MPLLQEVVLEADLRERGTRVTRAIDEGLEEGMKGQEERKT